MLKIVIIGLMLLLAYLFVPRYDLYESESSFNDQYTLRKKGFLSKDNCYKKGKQLKNVYRCMHTSAWQDMMGVQREYNKEREIE